jgi:hypothetical protein
MRTPHHVSGSALFFHKSQSFALRQPEEGGVNAPDHTTTLVDIIAGSG